MMFVPESQEIIDRWQRQKYLSAHHVLEILKTKKMQDTLYQFKQSIPFNLQKILHQLFFVEWTTKDDVFEPHELLLFAELLRNNGVLFRSQVDCVQLNTTDYLINRALKSLVTRGVVAILYCDVRRYKRYARELIVIDLGFVFEVNKA